MKERTRGVVIQQSRRLAAKVSEIADPVERNRIARACCLAIITKYSDFRESVFLRRCGVPVNDRVGPALKVKKTKHWVRTVPVGERHVPLSRRQQNQKYYRATFGDLLDCGDVGDRTSQYHVLRLKVRQSPLESGYRMY